MKEYKSHIIHRFAALLLVIAVLTPTAVKLAHILENHEHEVCIGKSSSHLHELNIDCEFYKFKLSTYYFQFIKPIESLKFNTTNKEVISQYYFISDYQKLQTSLRGPPFSA